MSVLEELDQIRAHLTAPGQPFEMVDRDVGGHTVRVYKNAPVNLTPVIAAAKAFEDRTFMVAGAQRVSFGQALGRAAGLAIVLQERYGVGPGARVSIAMRNSPDWVIVFLATMLTGAAAALINSRGTADEMLSAVRDIDGALVIADAKRGEVLARDHDGPMLTAEAGELRDRSGETIAITDATPQAIDIDASAPALMLFTSGTTGRPKAAVLTHLGVNAFLFGLRQAGAVYLTHAAIKLGQDPAELARAFPQPSTLAIFPFFHVSGVSSVILSAVMTGGKIVFMERWDPDEAFALIGRERITQLQGPPSIYWDMLGCASFADADMSSVSNIGIGGQATPANLLQAIRRAWPGAATGAGFGMTETNGAIAAATGDEYLVNPGAAGRLTPGVRVRIVDAQGADLPVGETGEILVQGALVMAEYWNQPEANAALFRDGWFNTGDIGFVDAQRFITIVDRKKDMVIRGGENIYCAELERVFLTCPGVREAAAFGAPDPRWGERVVLAVRRHDDAALDAETLLAFAKGKLADFKQPSEIVITTNPFPRNTSDKIDKRALRAALHPQ